MSKLNPNAATAYVTVICPHCGNKIELAFQIPRFQLQVHIKREINRSGDLGFLTEKSFQVKPKI